MKHQIIVALSLILVLFGCENKNEKSPGNAILLENVFTRALTQFFNWEAEESVYLETDKSLYEPGETVWMSLFVRNGKDLNASEKSQIAYVEVINPKGGVVKTLNLISLDGRTKADFLFEDQMVGGIYKLKAYTNWQKNTQQFFEKEITLQKVVVPRVKMKIDFEKKAYGPGDSVFFDFKLESLANLPLGNKSLRTAISINGIELETLDSKTNTQGEVKIGFLLPKELKSNDGIINVSLLHNSARESISRSIPIVLNKIALSFYPEGGDLVYGFKGQVALKALNEYGKAADVSGVVMNSKGEKVTAFKSQHMGMAKFDLEPKAGEFYFVKITRPEGIEKEYKIPLSKESHFGLKVLQTMDSLHENQSLDLQVYTPQKQILTLISQVRGNIVDSREIKAEKGLNSLLINATEWPTGIAQLTLFDENKIERAERLVFVNRDKQLKIEIKTDREKYQPRELVQMEIKVKDTEGNPSSGTFALSVVDDALLNFNDDKQGDLLTAILLEKELKTKVEEPRYYFDQKEKESYAHLDLLMMTSGWRSFEWKEILKGEKREKEFPGELAQVKGNLQNCADSLSLKLYPSGRMVSLADDGSFLIKDLDLMVDHTLKVWDRETLIKNIELNDYSYEVSNNCLPEIVYSRGQKGLQRNMDFARDIDAVLKNVGGLKKEGRVGLGGRRGKVNPGFNEAFAEGGAGGIGDLLGGLMGGGAVQMPMKKEIVEKKKAVREMRAARGKGVPQAPIARGVLRILERHEVENAQVAEEEMMDQDVGMEDFFRPAQNMAKRKVNKPRPFDEKKYYRARIFPAPNYTEIDADAKRSDFRTTLFWEPILNVDSTGRALLQFYNGDAISSFKTRISGVGTQGLLGRAEHLHYTQLPFSLNATIPAELTGGDTLFLPVSILNNTAKKMHGHLSVEVPQNLELVQAPEGELSIPSTSSIKILLPLFVKSVNAIDSIKLTFQSAEKSDEVQREIRTVVKGFKRNVAFSGSELVNEYTVDLKGLIPGSARVQFQAYPSVVDDLLQGIESILREPYGCFEQTSVSSYPNALILKYLMATESKNQQTLQRARELLSKGYQRLTTFETTSKGYEWFGGAPGHEALTAYGLMQFADMKAVGANVDQKMFERTSRWLLDRKDHKGGYKSNPKALDQYGRASNEITAAFITYALSEAGFAGEIKQEAQKVFENARTLRDPYLLSLAAMIAVNLQLPAKALSFVKELKSFQEKDGSWMGKSHSITHSTGQSLREETTALAIQALVKYKMNASALEINQGVKYLTQSRRNGGGFSTTQATIQSLRALALYAQEARKTKSSGTLLIKVNETVVAQKKYEANQSGAIIIEGLEKYFSQGSKRVVILFTQTKSAMPFSLNIDYYTDLPESATMTSLDFKVSLNQSKIKVGDLTRASMEVKNLNRQVGLPMTMVVFGIPGGLSAQPWQLKELQEKKIFDFYEIKGNQLALYWRQMKPDEVKNVDLDLKAEVGGDYTGSASRSYLYYTPETTIWKAGVHVQIQP